MDEALDQISMQRSQSAWSHFQKHVSSSSVQVNYAYSIYHMQANTQKMSTTCSSTPG